MTVDPNVKFSMKVPLGDGTFTNGRTDYTRHPHLLGLDDVDLSGMRVLDIAANDGYWTFWAEQRGVRDLLAVDVDAFEDYDWGWGGVPEHVKQQMTANHESQWPEDGRGFKELHQHFDSVARRETSSVYRLDPERHGEFDLVFNYGLLHRLRHPLLSLDRSRAVCRGALLLETHVVTGFRQLPLSLFYWDDAFRAYTNWTGPTEAMVAAWLRSAGFHDVWICRPGPGQGQGSAVFAASVSDDWSDRFESAPDLVKFDDAYLADSRRQLRSIIDG